MAYEKAIEIKPDFDEAYYSIGFVYASSNKFKEAIEAYEKAIEIKPSNSCKAIEELLKAYRNTTSINTLAMSNSSRVVVVTLRALFIF
jgi:tetratricopeptide (TPR) repeat protein